MEMSTEMLLDTVKWISKSKGNLVDLYKHHTSLCCPAFKSFELNSHFYFKY